MDSVPEAASGLEALIALGSNLGSRRDCLEAGLRALEGLGRVHPSPLVTDTPDESGRGGDYLNTVAFLETPLADPRRLLEELLRIELRLGRDRRSGRNAPRPLDLDLVALRGLRGRWAWPSPADLAVLGPELDLVLPHPRALGRPFVMGPLGALAEALGRPLADWVAEGGGGDRRQPE